MGRMLHALGLSVLVALAAVAAHAESLCLKGCPVGAPAPNKVISRHIYVLSNNGTTKFADWVAYRVTRDSIGKTAERRWSADPDLPGAETLEPPDYEGASAALRVDRGHQAPLASFTGTPHWSMTNFLSNITPLSSTLNQGPWERLESAERALARRPGVSAVYVVTGPLFEQDMRALPRADESHRVPSGYWKIVAVEDGEGLATSAFVMHQDTGRNANFCNYVVPIRDIEERTSFDFFSELQRSKQDEIEMGPGRLFESLGCRVVKDSRGVRVRRENVR